MFSFSLTHTDGLARRGVIHTAHGDIETPVFMPVGTQGVVKALTVRDLEEAGAAIILGNTYHLYLRPGDELIARRGGLHRFSGWSRPILTDSGGYQVFSLSDRRKVEEHGVHFRSHLDGSAHLLTPEKTVEIQANLGSDIAMVLDECPPLPSTTEVIDRSLELTARWARRSRDRFVQFKDAGPGVFTQAQFGIVQGGSFPDLRQKSAELTVSIGFDGYAIGGLSVGEPNETMYEIVEQTAPLLPPAQPRYLMGVGTPLDIVEAVARGIDMFDCVLPTRNARNGQLLTSEGPLNIKNAQFSEDDGPADPACGCYTCRHFSRAYLRHLYMAGEMTGGTLNTLHNLSFYLDTMRRIREAIAFGRFEVLRQQLHRTFTRRALIS
ncbi:MAG: tRNA guanosine(34) transglycosylase Tgt [Acidobacteria bacterium RIFCSPLOWO2_12_FULL_67_14b]|nr:MAG: tRNA guanosine(34) transglycosylase Tgt [Acidobacteria bacterium RIFCSPLOWO2_12_FULL_67_14b]